MHYIMQASLISYASGFKFIPAIATLLQKHEAIHVLSLLNYYILMAWIKQMFQIYLGTWEFT